MVAINEQAPEFIADAYVPDEIKKIALKEYRGKWVVLFFYPADFTFVCPTELGELADKYDSFKALGAEILSVSTDTAYVHKAWHDVSPTIRKITFPMLADPTRKICNAYGTLIHEEGIPLRATFIIDPDGKVKAFEFHDTHVGRNIDELHRKIEAYINVREHGGDCPVNWSKGKKMLTPNINMVGKI